MSQVAYEAQEILKRVEERIAYNTRQRDYWTARFERFDPPGGQDRHYEHARKFEHIHALLELYAVKGIIEREIAQAHERAKFETEGYKSGRNAGKWVIDGNTNEQAKERIVRGIEAGDPEILDQLPPLEPGNVIEEATWTDLYCDIMEIDMQDFPEDGGQDMFEVWNEAYTRGVQDEIVQTVRGYSVGI